MCRRDRWFCEGTRVSDYSAAGPASVLPRASKQTFYQRRVRHNVKRRPS